MRKRWQTGRRLTDARICNDDQDVCVGRERVEVRSVRRASNLNGLERRLKFAVGGMQKSVSTKSKSSETGRIDSRAAKFESLDVL